MFDTVEITNSFYHLLERETLERRVGGAPEEFVFAPKASRYTTRMKKLKDPAEPVNRFFDRMEVLGEELRPVLFQLSPNGHQNLERLRAFLEVLPADRRCAVEFRDPSWWDADIFALLEDRGVGSLVVGQAVLEGVRTLYDPARAVGAG